MNTPNYQDLRNELSAVREAAIILAQICRDGRGAPCPVNCPGETACGIAIEYSIAPGADLTPLVQDYHGGNYKVVAFQWLACIATGIVLGLIFWRAW